MRVTREAAIAPSADDQASPLVEMCEANDSMVMATVEPVPVTAVGTVQPTVHTGVKPKGDEGEGN